MYSRGELNTDFIAVLKEQGAKSKRMLELHKLTPVMATLQDRVQSGYRNRRPYVGASGKVPAAIHLAPEAVEGGVIAKIHEGDLITLDAPAGVLRCM
ncbi:dihydroxy-acid dehydratase [Pseudoalteromonas lipolytica]|uniref:dihydroxy-acid dehydratase domain-containing protein n=1 Tax=Pseudoalteromonas lipolytica TaxID=570156 RepID=UPI003A9708BF